MLNKRLMWPASLSTGTITLTLGFFTLLSYLQISSEFTLNVTNFVKMTATLRTIVILLISALPAGCSLPKVNSNARPIVHQSLTTLLQKHVSSDGRVNYASLKADSNALNDYLGLLEHHHPNKGWTSNERKAYWINTYNAFTLRLIIRNYPVSSIKDLGGAVYKVNTPWDIRFITIEGYNYDLNNIEHDILRKEWSDARIHFAVNCASVSCPILANTAYEAATLDTQLDEAARRFINDPTRNRLSNDEAELSKIFRWFKGDFTRKGNLIDFINHYAENPLNASASINYLDYDWNLNE